MRQALSPLIRNEVDKAKRFKQLRQIVDIQLKSLDEKDFMKALKKLSNGIYIRKKGID